MFVSNKLLLLSVLLSNVHFALAIGGGNIGQDRGPRTEITREVLRESSTGVIYEMHFVPTKVTVVGGHFFGIVLPIFHGFDPVAQKPVTEHNGWSGLSTEEVIIREAQNGQEIPPSEIKSLVEFIEGHVLDLDIVDDIGGNFSIDIDYRFPGIEMEGYFLFESANSDTPFPRIVRKQTLEVPFEVLAQKLSVDTSAEPKTMPFSRLFNERAVGLLLAPVVVAARVDGQELIECSILKVDGRELSRACKERALNEVALEQIVSGQDTVDLGDYLDQLLTFSKDDVFHAELTDL